MYKYFRELENLREFKTYLAWDPLDKNQDLSLYNINYTNDLLKKLQVLFPKLMVIDDMIMGLNKQLLAYSLEDELLSDEIWSKSDVFFHLRENYSFSSHRILEEEVKLTTWELQCILKEIDEIIPLLSNFYSNHKDFLLDTQKQMKALFDEIEKKSTIKMPPKRSGIAIEWPAAWYITPNGYLYNTGFGHKKGNLVNSLYYTIYELLKENKSIPSIHHADHIHHIIERGYITDKELRDYYHLIYRLPTIVTPEVEIDRMRYKNLLRLSKTEYKRITSTPDFEYPNPERSYQKNLITLITGYLSAETALYSSFNRVNNSLSKRELLTQLKELTRNDIRDVLVRFSGFHKIESIVDKTITTSSLYAIKEFSNYLNAGWSLHIIPGIVYDEMEDKLFVIDFNSYFIKKHLEQELANFEGTGKILIKDS